jgi:hypothetical protein
MSECPEGWKVTGTLGQGGQGKVRKVQRCDDPTLAGSLKILQRQEDKKARRRFHTRRHFLKRFSTLVFRSY